MNHKQDTAVYIYQNQGLQLILIPTVRTYIQFILVHVSVNVGFSLIQLEIC